MEYFYCSCCLPLRGVTRIHRALRNTPYPKGSHYCKGWRWGLSRTPYRHFQFSFDSTALYNSDVLGKGWSKVAGFTVFHTHWNSCRVGWQVEDNKIQLGYYCYVGHKRISGVLTETLPGEINEAECFWDKNRKEYVVRINGIEKSIPQPRKSLFYLYTYPFFGGKFTAHQNIKIRVKNLNPEAQPWLGGKFLSAKRPENL